MNKVFGKRSSQLLDRFLVFVNLVATARLPRRRVSLTRRRQQRDGAARRRRLLYPVQKETHFSFMAGFVDALRPEKFTDVHFKRWQVKVTLWLTAMNVFWVSTGKPEGDLITDQEKAYSEANTIFLGTVIGVLVDHLQDVYIHHTVAKDMWDALIADYGGSDAGAELYVIEQYHNFKMVDGKFVVAQAHEIHCIVKELELLKIIVPEKFVAGGIIVKLSPTWRNFATTLKHKRTNISVSDLIASLDVEEKAREKDGCSKVNKGNTITNMVHQQQQSHGSGGKGKGKNNKPKQTTTFKKKNKENGSCFVCGSNVHWAKKCPERKGRKSSQQKSANMVARDSSVLMGNGSHASVHGVGTVKLKFTLGKII
ncbi:hypothetical protein QOZ80_5BG0425590 [Eleusine coracana subsp. coracana]|nr:hypothetical protein QOZ80_5BG0425590 [Eleusine coracana subsp. coracana]